MLDRAETIGKALEILGGPDAEEILRESMSDMADLIELGVLEVDVTFTRERLARALGEPKTADDVIQQFGARSVAQSILEAAERRS